MRMERQRSAEMDSFVEDAFDDLDSAIRLSHVPHATCTPTNPSQPSASGQIAGWPGVHGNTIVYPGMYRLSGEEQAWLDAEFHEMQEVEMEDYSADDASCAASINGCVDEADEETEDEYVRHLLTAHPAVEEAEARWLWRCERASRMPQDPARSAG